MGGPLLAAKISPGGLILAGGPKFLLHTNSLGRNLISVLGLTNSLGRRLISAFVLTSHLKYQTILLILLCLAVLFPRLFLFSKYSFYVGISLTIIMVNSRDRSEL